MHSLLIVMMLYPVFTFGKSKSPVMAAFKLLLLSSTLGTIMYMKGATWIPMIFLMVFIGGVLMVFLILSSLMPNKKIKKSNKTNFAAVTSFLALVKVSLIKTHSSQMHMEMVKVLISNPLMLIFITIVMTIYFMIISIMNNKESLSLRTYF